MQLTTNNWLPFQLVLHVGQHEVILAKNVPFLKKLAIPLSSFHWLPCLSLYKITTLPILKNSFDKTWAIIREVQIGLK